MRQFEKIQPISASNVRCRNQNEVALRLCHERNAPRTKLGRGALDENGELDCEAESGRPVWNASIRYPMRCLDHAEFSAADHGRARRRSASPGVCQACVAKFGCRSTWPTTSSSRRIEAHIVGPQNYKECGPESGANDFCADRMQRFHPRERGTGRSREKE